MIDRLHSTLRGLCDNLKVKKWGGTHFLTTLKGVSGKKLFLDMLKYLAQK